MALDNKSCVGCNLVGAACSFSTVEPLGSWSRLLVGRRTAKHISEGRMQLIMSTAEEAEGTGESGMDRPFSRP